MALKNKKEENFSEWFLELLQEAQIVDKRTPDSSGFYAYPPAGTIIMKKIEGLFEKGLEKTGHKPIRTPTVIPVSLLELEKEHAQGFMPEFWQITKGRGGKKLEIIKGLRPTGEVLIYSMFKYWVRSYRDLPLKCYETRPSFRAEPENSIFPLFRSHEFYWIEAHDVQRNSQEADFQVLEDMKNFESAVWDELSIPFKLFKRPEWDKFAGADYTCAYDAALPDGRVLQIGTTHNLGQNFSKAFQIQFLDEDESKKYAHQTCYGPGIGRMTGAMIVVHSDNNGLILPFNVCPTQIAIIPIIGKKDDELIKYCQEIKKMLSEYSAEIDERKEYSFGWKCNDWELKGSAFRIEVGLRELNDSKLTIADRINRTKTSIEIKDLKSELKKLIEKYNSDLKEKSKKLLKISQAQSMEELLKKNDSGIHLVEIPFCNEESCADKLKEHNIKIRGIELFSHGEKSVVECEEKSKERAKGKKCALCQKEAKTMSFAARQY